ncbi:MAG: hypothetical protein ABWK02_02415 [Aquificaceae bacterium]
MRKFTEILLNNRFIVITLSVFLLLYGLYSLKKTPIDALPDLTDTQVIIYSEWIGQAPPGYREPANLSFGLQHAWPAKGEGGKGLFHAQLLPCLHHL